MFLDHLTMTATNSRTEPERSELPSRVHGDAIRLANLHARARFVKKVTRIHDDKGTVIAFPGETLSETEKAHVGQAWASTIDDDSAPVEPAL